MLSNSGGAANNGMSIAANASNNAANNATPNGSDVTNASNAATPATGSRAEAFTIDPSTQQAPAPGASAPSDITKRIETNASLPGALPITGPGANGSNAGGRVDQMLVARNLTPQQAARLTAALSASQQPGQVKMIPGAGSAAAAAVQAIPIDPSGRNPTNLGQGWPMITALPPG